MTDGQTALCDAKIIPQGYLFGLTLSTAGGSVLFNVAAGSAVDSTGLNIMKLGAFQKNASVAWAVGSGNIGALDAGSLAAGTWYHVHLIKRPDTGVVDVLLSLSATAPTLPTNYTLFRRIGAMRTDPTPVLLKFSQLGDEFLWAVGILDVSTAAITSASRTLYSLTVPTGIQVNALIKPQITSTAGSTTFVVSSPDETDVAVGYTAGSGGVSIRTTTANDSAAAPMNVRTNTSGQIGGRANATTGSVSMMTYGWIDTRGKLN